MGFIVLAGMLACDGDDGNGPVGYVYIGTMELEKDQVYKLGAASGDKCYGLGGYGTGQLSIDVDPDNGDVYIYSTNHLRKYSSTGELYYDVYIGSGLLYDKMVYDGSRKAVWIFTSQSREVERRRGSDGELEDRFYTNFTDVDQMVYDVEEDVLWFVLNNGDRVCKFSPSGDLLLTITPPSGWRLTPMAIDNRADTLIIGYYETSTSEYSVRTYDRQGNLLGEFQTSLTPPPSTYGLNFEPVARRIWVSDGERVETYNVAGKLIDVIPRAGFVVSDFDSTGETFLGINAAGVVYALRLNDFSRLWETQTLLTERRYLALKYCALNY